MSFPNYVHIPGVANVPQCVVQLRVGDLIESRLGVNTVSFISNDGSKLLWAITTTHGVIVCSSEQEWSTSRGWQKASNVTLTDTLAYYFGDRVGFVDVLTIASLKADTTYKLGTELGEFVAAGHITRG